MLGNEARVRLERAANKVKAEGAFNQDKMTIGVEYQLLPGDYFVNVDLTSTLTSIRDVKLNLIHKLKKQPTIELHSMVRLHLSIYTLIRGFSLNFSFLLLQVYCKERRQKLNPQSNKKGTGQSQQLPY